MRGFYWYKKNENSDPKLVWIVDGEFEINGRISNAYGFYMVGEDMVVNSRKYCGDYNNRDSKFKKASFKSEIRAIPAKIKKSKSF